VSTADFVQWYPSSKPAASQRHETWQPQTCRKATIQVPIRQRNRMRDGFRELHREFTVQPTRHGAAQAQIPAVVALLNRTWAWVGARATARLAGSAIPDMDAVHCGYTVPRRVVPPRDSICTVEYSVSSQHLTPIRRQASWAVDTTHQWPRASGRMPAEVTPKRVGTLGSALGLAVGSRHKPNTSSVLWGETRPVVMESACC